MSDMRLSCRDATLRPRDFNTFLETKGLGWLRHDKLKHIGQLLLPDRNRQNRIAANDCINDIHSRDHSAENCVTAVEMGLWCMCDEPLRAPRVLAGERHSHSSAVKRDFVDFTANCIAGAAVTVTAWVPGLNYEIRNNGLNNYPP